MDVDTENRFTALYRIEAGSTEEARRRAFNAAIEQTAECPYSLIKDTFVAEEIIGRIESITPRRDGAYDVAVSYNPECVGNEFMELLNMLFGNISLQPGFRLNCFRLPEKMYDLFRGPRFGREGLRRLTGVTNGPIFMSAIKPLGLTSQELAHMVYEMALGGCHIIKDDHSLYDQKYAPFEDRVARCADAVREAEAKTGHRSLYIANCTADGNRFIERCMKAKALGADGIMAAPALTGFGLIRELAEDDGFGLPIFLHPCLSGGQVIDRTSGISPYCYYGQLSRLAGADAVIFTSYGGRFPFPPKLCLHICSGTACGMGRLKSIFPVPSGGMRWEIFDELVRIYGQDIILLVGGALQTHNTDLTESVSFFLQKLKDAQSQ